MINTSSGDIASSTTNGDASFFAQGLLQTVENTIVSTTTPIIQRTSVSDSRVTTTTSSQDVPVAGWWDPLAQTFLIAPAQHGQGIFVEKIRVCFKTKHDTSPVTLQLRPTVNGYPSSKVLPFSRVEKKAADVKISSDATLVTYFSGSEGAANSKNLNGFFYGPNIVGTTFTAGTNANPCAEAN
mgnify:CR=1 FL=1